MLQKCKTLCHEPLEERQLLAVDSGMSAVFPQACEYYVGEQAASFVTPVVTNRDETALVPGNVVDAGVPQRIYGPLPFEQSEMYVSMLSSNWGGKANHPGSFDLGDISREEPDGRCAPVGKRSALPLIFVFVLPDGSEIANAEALDEISVPRRGGMFAN